MGSERSHSLRILHESFHIKGTYYAKTSASYLMTIILYVKYLRSVSVGSFIFSAAS